MVNRIRVLTFSVLSKSRLVQRASLSLATLISRLQNAAMPLVSLRVRFAKPPPALWAMNGRWKITGFIVTRYGLAYAVGIRALGLLSPHWLI